MFFFHEWIRFEIRFECTELILDKCISDARSEDHICQCVRKGDRPDEDLISADTPVEITELMKRCWHQDPQLRPTFQGACACV